MDGMFSFLKVYIFSTDKVSPDSAFTPISIRLRGVLHVSMFFGKQVYDHAK